MKRIMKQSRYWLPFLTLTATVAAPQMVAPAHAGLFGMSEQDEIAAGQEVAAQAEKEYGGALPYNDPMSVRVRAIGAQFAAKSERKNIPYTFKVLNNDKVLNAFAAPGGPIYVTRKLVTTTANDAELAYVLGHEAAHIDRKHIVESVEKQQKAGLVVGVLGAILGGKGGNNTIGTIANVGWTVLSRGYGRDQERESDIVGTRWMSQLGYDPRAAISMLGKLEGGGSGGFLDKYLSTHPNPKDRQAVVEQIIANENLTDVARRSGGPRLWMTGSSNQWNTPAYGNTTYNNTYNNPTNTNDTYPTYPGTTTPAPANNPPYPNTYNGQINFGAPLVLTQRGNTNVVLAPIAELARWAGATLRFQNNAAIMKHAGNTIILRPRSTKATINGRDLTMSAPALIQDGRLYAPLGTAVQGIGGQASYDAQTRTIWITVDNQRGYVPLQ